MYYQSDTYRAHSSIGYLVRRGASLMRAQVEAAFVDRGLTFMQWAALLLLRDHPDYTASDLCRELHHDSGALTRLLDQLETRGLISRQRRSSDRRLIRLMLLPAGRTLMESLLPIVVERMNEAVSDFTAAEVSTLTHLLERMITRLESVGEDRSVSLPRIAK
jgi:DNA-binding MarR family transcriptional regulator